MNVGELIRFTCDTMLWKSTEISSGACFTVDNGTDVAMYLGVAHDDDGPVGALMYVVLTNRGIEYFSCDLYTKVQI